MEAQYFQDWEIMGLPVVVVDNYFYRYAVTSFLLRKPLWGAPYRGQDSGVYLSCIFLLLACSAL
jgi:hypothetical protein